MVPVTFFAAIRRGSMIDLIRRSRHFLFVKLAVIYLRFLIGFAFVFASIIKIRGERFTSIPVTEPIGYFFEALYQSGFYWNFLGWSQFISGALLMSQRFSTIGAMVFLPVILNVFMITHSIDFGSGTPLVTSLMLMGTIFLLMWDYPKWSILFMRDHTIRLDLTQSKRDTFMDDPLWVVAAVLFILLTVAFWLVRAHFVIYILLMLTVGLGAMLSVFCRYRKRTRIGHEISFRTTE